jgi:tubulin-specific chaperone E
MIRQEGSITAATRAAAISLVRVSEALLFQQVADGRVGLSKSATAASFVRPSRKADPAQDFISALHEKYASDEAPDDRDGTPKQASVQIQFSGKVVEEVGFDKIRRRLAQLQDLRVVILDGLRIKDASGGQSGAGEAESIKRECPKIVELDLSRNLFTNFGTVLTLCSALEELRTLRLKYGACEVLQTESETVC